MKIKGTSIGACLLAGAMLFMTACGSQPDVSGPAAGGTSGALSSTEATGDSGFAFNGSFGTGTQASPGVSGANPANPANPENPGNPGGVSVPNTPGGQNQNPGKQTAAASTGKTGSQIGQEIPGGNTASDPAGMTTIRLATVTGSLLSGNAAGASLYGSLFKEKAAEIRKKYQVNLKYVNVTASDESAIATALFAGQKPFDILYYSTAFARHLALSGLLLDQKSISSINLNAAQFKRAQGFTDGMTFKGKVYGSLFGSEMDNIPVMYCNQTLIDTHTGKGKYDILKLYKNNEWTMEKYREIAKAVKTVDGSGSTTVWGASQGMGNGVFLAAYAGGTVNRDANGKYYPAMLSDAGVQAIELLRTMQHTDRTMETTADGRGLFKNGKIAMIPFNLSEASSLVPQTNGDVVAVPIPKAPTQSSHVFSARGRYYMIPKTADNLDLIGKVYMELSTIDLDKYYLSLFVNSGMTEENGKLALERFPAYAKAEFIDGVDTPRFDAELVEIYNSSTGSVKAGFDAVRPKFQAAIDDCYSRENNLK